MPPANSATRAGAMPEASGDSSSGTLAENMRVLALMLFVVFGNLACSTNQNENPPQSSRRLKAPAHPDVEFFIVRLSSAQELSISRPNLKYIWNKHIPFSLGPMLERAPYFPTTLFEYIGTKLGRDYYRVIFNSGESGKDSIIEVIYAGSESEVFRNTEYMIGIRPRTKQKKANEPVDLL